MVEQRGVFRGGRPRVRQHLDRLLDVLDELLTGLPSGSVRSQGAMPQFGERDRSDGDVVGLGDPGDALPVAVELGVIAEEP